jgi:hypothetical protein
MRTKNPKKRPPLRTLITPTPRPSAGGRGTGYSLDFREFVLAAHDGNQNNNDFIKNQQAAGLYPHRSTVNRWTRRRQGFGTFRPFRRTGNARATVLVYEPLLHLALWRVLWPRGNAHEANIFLHHAGGRQWFYQPSQIYRAEDRIGLSRKRGSVTARQALLPINMQIRWNYWNLPFPFGIADIERKDLIDLDEAALFEETCNRGQGKAHITRRVRDIGAYGHSQKTTILLAISGEEATPAQSSRRWIETWEEGGTTIERMYFFIRRILNDIGPGTINNQKCFTMDNLNSHRWVHILSIPLI